MIPCTDTSLVPAPSSCESRRVPLPDRVPDADGKLGLDQALSLGAAKNSIPQRDLVGHECILHHTLSYY